VHVVHGLHVHDRRLVVRGVQRLVVGWVQRLVVGRVQRRLVLGQLRRRWRRGLVHVRAGHLPRRWGVRPSNTQLLRLRHPRDLRRQPRDLRDGRVLLAEADRLRERLPEPGQHRHPVQGCLRLPGRPGLLRVDIVGQHHVPDGRSRRHLPRRWDGRAAVPSERRVHPGSDMHLADMHRGRRLGAVQRVRLAERVHGQLMVVACQLLPVERATVGALTVP